MLAFRLGAGRRAMLSPRSRDATTPKGQHEPPSVGFSFASGGVGALALVTAILSWPETKIEPILWVPIIDPWYKGAEGDKSKS